MENVTTDFELDIFGWASIHHEWGETCLIKIPSKDECENDNDMIVMKDSEETKDS